MRLSMWILANRLEYLEPELHLSGQGPQTLLSARLRYAQDCVYVYDDGPNAVCRHEDGCGERTVEAPEKVFEPKGGDDA